MRSASLKLPTVVGATATWIPSWLAGSSVTGPRPSGELVMRKGSPGVDAPVMVMGRPHTL